MKKIPFVIVVILLLSLSLASCGGTYGLQRKLADAEQRLSETESILDQTQQELTETKESETQTLSDLAESQSESTTAQEQFVPAQQGLTQTQNPLSQAHSDPEHSQIDLIAVAAEQELSQTLKALAQAKWDLEYAQSDLESRERVLSQLKSDLAEANRTLVARETELENLKLWYSDLRQNVNYRLGNGKDAKKFITPDDEFVTNKVDQVAGEMASDVSERWSDFKKLYDWVVNNIDYAEDTDVPLLPATLGTLNWVQDYWRTPRETLADRRGDCEDMAFLLTSMLANYVEGKYAKWVITWLSEPEKTRHVAVAFPVGDDELTILDPAGKYYTRNGGRLGSLPTEEAINDWLAQWEDENPGLYVYRVFSDVEYREFSSTLEFLEWRQSR